MAKMALGWPWSPPFVYTAFLDSILQLEHPCETKWIRGGGWCNARRRISICEQAIEWGADYITMLDADQTYPPDILRKFLKHMEEGKDMVAAMVPQRGYTAGTGTKPFQRLAWKTEDNLTLIPVRVEDGELQQIVLPTCAAICFHTRDLRRLAKPWFVDNYDPLTLKRKFAEDLNFVLNMAKVGVEGWVDTTIEVKHLHLFQIDETFSERFADWEQSGGDPAICRYEVIKHKWFPNRGKKIDSGNSPERWMGT